MVGRHYSQGEKRALNIVWDASGQYGTYPPFLAVRHDEPSFYMNLIIGLSQKWLDIDSLNSFFLSYSGASKASDYDAIVWLCLENWLFHRELPERPVLKSLRHEYAASFCANEGTLSRQQMMVNDTSVIAVSRAHWASVAGEKTPHLSSHEKKILSLAEYEDSNATTDDVVEHLKILLMEGFHFSDFRMDADHVKAAAGPMRDFLSMLMRHEYRHVDSLLNRQDIISGYGSGAYGSVRDKHVSGRSDADTDYVRACFGPCILSDKEMHILHNELCTGTHELCDLWVAGTHKPSDGRVSEAALVDEQTKAQMDKNRSFYQKNFTLIEGSVKKLSSELESVLSAFMEPLPVEAKAGKLISEKAWRMPVLDDTEIFEKPGDEVESAVTVDLLLDASASRSASQEQIASQAYIIAKALEHVHIRCRIMDFHSLRGYTVLQILKGYNSNDDRGIFQYSAAGWNRDGLALSLAGRLMEADAGEAAKRIFFIMTDANPSDSTKVPPEGKDVFMHEYGGETGLDDTQKAVTTLQNAGITTGAIFTGPDLYVKNVKRIYGEHFVRIRHVEDLAGGVSELLQKLLARQGGQGTVLLSD
ncbi:MAG: hypothetical protein PUG04_04340 [Lachnospiraceae bacterium]|nr:hypothetical protein [Lachnospiraceae bacterium]